MTMQNQNYANYYNNSGHNQNRDHQQYQHPQQHQHQHQQHRPQNSQIFSNLSDSAPSAAVSSTQQQSVQQNGQFRPQYNALADRYSYNARQPAAYQMPNQQRPVNPSASNLTPNLYRQQFSPLQNHSPQQAPAHQNTAPATSTQQSCYGQIQRPNSFDQPSSAFRTNFAASNQNQPARAASPQWPQTHPTSFERAQPSHNFVPGRPSSQGSNSDRPQSSYQRDLSEHATVDPSAVYDASHEYLRQVQIDTERRAQEAARLKELAREAADEDAKRAEAKKAEAVRIAAEEEEARARSAAKLSRETKAVGRHSATAPKAKQKAAELASRESEQVQPAANSPSRDTIPAANNNSENDLEAQMREVFRKMRELNQQNPDMLARLWQQERDAHVAAAHQSQQAPSHSQHAGTSAPPKIVNKPSPSNPPPSTFPKNTKVAPSKPGAKPSSPQTSPKEAPNATQAQGTSQAQGVTHRMGSIAEAAVRKLKDFNRGRTMSFAEISAILDDNSTYLDFCAAIESKGLAVDRGLFAEALVTAFPGLGKLNPQNSLTFMTNTGKLLGPAKLKAATFPKPKPKPKNAADRPSETTVATTGLAIDPQLEGLDAVKRFVDGAEVSAAQPPPSQLQRTGAKSKDSKSNRGPAQSLPPAPVTKHDLARKRTFQDLIDLTNGTTSSDEEVVSLPKRPETSDPSPQQLLTPEAVHLSTQGPRQAPTAPMTSHSAAEAVPGPLALGASIEAPPPDLGIHQRPQLQPPLPSLPLVPADHPSRNIMMIQPIDKYKALRRSTYNPKTIARDVLIASGRHPEMRHLNAHLESLRAAFTGVSYDSDLGTFRWDIADPGGAAPGSGAQLEQRTASIVDELDADDEVSDNDSVIGGVGRTRQTITTNGGVGVLGQSPTITVSIKKKPGRPPRTAPPVNRWRPGSGETEQQQRPTGMGRGDSSRAPSSTPMTYHELRLQAEAQQRARGEVPAVKKPGRPVGWRKWMQKSDGGAPKTPSAKPPPAKKPSPEPKFEVYKCEWKNCGAELHNLATLRRHLFKLHGKAGVDGYYACLWSGCGRVETKTDADDRRTKSSFVTAIFPDAEQWGKHVDKKHLTPIAWKLGDGPKGGLSDNYESEVSESYMSDSQGRRVTPRVVGVPAESAASGSGTQRRRTREEREAEEEQRAEETRKRDIGPGLDRQGATLANAKRRQGFIDYEDTAEVVDEDD